MLNLLWNWLRSNQRLFDSFRFNQIVLRIEMVHHNSKHSQLKYVNDIFVFFIIVDSEFSRIFPPNWSCSTPASSWNRIPIVIPQEEKSKWYSEGEEQHQSFGFPPLLCRTTSVYKTLLSPKWSRSTAAGTVFTRRERDVLSIGGKDKHQSLSLKVKLAQPQP